jgi:hypothetical protein
MKLKRISAAVLATSMVLAVSADAMALTPEATVSAKNTTTVAAAKTDRVYMSPVQYTQSHRLNPYTNVDLWEMGFTFPYWKIAVQNNTSHKMVVELMQDAPNITVGTYIQKHMEIPPYSFKEFYCKTPLESRINPDETSYLDKVYAKNGLAYAQIFLPDGSITLDGTIWYKSATTAEYLRSTEAEPGK